MSDGEQKTGVRAFFDGSDGWRGQFYRDANDPFGQMLVRRKDHVLRLFRRHVDRSAATVFDAGCGPGEYIAELGAAGFRVFAMDASEEMVRTSGELVRGREWERTPGLVRGDIEHVPFRSASFDAVLCIGVLGYLEGDERALRELHRLLKPGGHLILNVRNLNALTSLHYSGRLKARHLARRGWRDLRSAVSLATHTRGEGWKSRAYNVGRLETLVGSLGFRRVEGLTFGYELKALAKVGVSGRAIVRLEALLERFMLAIPLRPLRYAGWGYVGLFRKEPAAG